MSSQRRPIEKMRSTFLNKWPNDSFEFRPSIKSRGYSPDRLLLKMELYISPSLFSVSPLIWSREISSYKLEIICILNSTKKG